MNIYSGSPCGLVGQVYVYIGSACGLVEEVRYCEFIQWECVWFDGTGRAL